MPAPVTAIVLNWCNASETAACLESLAESTYEALTVLLVDNGSPDGSGDILHEQFAHVPYLQTGSNLGYTGGNNRGMDWAIAHGAEFLLVLNNDTVIDPECVSAMMRAAVETQAALVVPQIVYFDEPGRVWYAGGDFAPMRALGMHRRQDQLVDPADTRAPISFACGCCFLIRADVARAMGGFHEPYFAYVEDLDLSFRLIRAGHALVYEPTAMVQHRIARHEKTTPFQIRQGGRNRRRFVRLHYTILQRIRFMCWFYPTRLVHLARYAVTGQWTHARAIVDGLFSTVTL